MISSRCDSTMTRKAIFSSRSIAAACRFADTRMPRRSSEACDGCARTTCTSSRPIGTGGGKDAVEQFGVKQLRVLTVTTSARRIETMIDALHDVTGGKGSELFLFIEDDVLRNTNPLDALWITGKGRERRLTQ